MEIGKVPNVSIQQTKPIETAATVYKTKSETSVEKPKVNKMATMQESPEHKPSIQEELTNEILDKVKEKLGGADREFQFALHEETNQIMVKVLDTSTKEVIREIPSEKILDMVADMCEAAGIFVDEKR